MAELTRKQKIQQALWVALIAAGGSLMTVIAQAWLTSYLAAPKLRTENIALKEDLGKKSLELQKVETELAPFKALAFQNFAGTDAERLAKLAQRLHDVESGFVVLSEKQNAIAATSNRLARQVSAAEQKIANQPTQLPPRRIAAEQKVNFNRITADFPKADVEVIYSVSIPETVQFAKDLESMLNGAGFKSGLNNYIGITIGGLPKPWEVGIAVGRDAPSKLAGALQGALQKIGIDAPGIRAEDVIPAGAIKLFVGTR